MYVINTATGDRHQVRITKLSTRALKKLSKDKVRFQFDWTDTCDTIYKLVIIATGEVLGLVAIDILPAELRIEICLLEVSSENIGRGKKYEHIAGMLIAHTCRLSFELGFFGFVSLVPKTRLIKHYQSTYGFVSYGTHLVVDLEASERLINKYLEDEKK